MSITLQDFQRSLSGTQPPAGLAPPLRALWFDGVGDWHRAHAEVDDKTGAEACRVHGYLHRREGDPANAAYWYRRAGVPTVTGALDDERQALLHRLLPD